MAYNKFGNLIKITKWSSWTGLSADKKAGSIIFVDTTADTTSGAERVKLIYANGIEYRVADTSDFIDLSTYVYTTVNSSISEVSTRLSDTSSRLADASSRLADASSRLADLSTYVRETVDVSIADISTRVANVSTYVHNTVDVSIKDISTRLSNTTTDLADLSTYVRTTIDASIKGSLNDASITASVADKTATVNLKTLTNAGTAANTSFTIKGDDYLTVGGSANAIALNTNITDDKDGIAHAVAHTAGTDSSLATAYAVKDYVDDKMGALRALTLKGSVGSSSALESILQNTDSKKGDTYVVNAEFTSGTTKFEIGDMVILDKDAASGSPATYFVVERNLTGAVVIDSSLVADKVVLGAGTQSVKTSAYGIGADTSHAAASSTLATENWVKSEIDAINVTVDSSTPDYLVGAPDGSLGVKYGVVTATLADASDGSIGLALAKDVYEVITANEEVVTNSFAAIKNSVGLTDELDVSWGGKFASNTTVVKAIEDLSTDLHNISADAVRSVTGEDPLAPATGTTAVDEYVAVSATEDASSNVTLNSSVLVANVPTRVDGSTASVATGLATDAYVKDYVANVLVWEVYNS